MLSVAPILILNVYATHHGELGTRNMDTCHVSDNYFLPTMSPADCIDHSQPIGIYLYMEYIIVNSHSLFFFK